MERPDFNGDGYADLAVGAPSEDVGSLSEAGAVNVLYGSVGGLSSAGSHFGHQGTPGIRDRVEGGDRAGSSLA